MTNQFKTEKIHKKTLTIKLKSKTKNPPINPQSM